MHARAPRVPRPNLLCMRELTEVVVGKRLQVGRRRQDAVVIRRFPVVPPLLLRVLAVPQVFLHHFLKRQMLFEALHAHIHTHTQVHARNASDILKANKLLEEGVICRRSAARLLSNRRQFELRSTNISNGGVSQIGKLDISSITLEQRHYVDRQKAWRPISIALGTLGIEQRTHV